MQAAKLVFYFDDPLEFLNSYLQEKRKTQTRFSLRAWARQLGYENPSLLFQVLKGERKLKMDLALRIATNLNLTGKSLRYFELLVLHRASQSPTERYVFETMLATLRPAKLREVNKISLDLYTATSDWYHWAIYAMTSLDDFSAEPAWIQKRLGADTDRKTIKLALERLIRLGFLAEQGDGTYRAVAMNDVAVLRERALPAEALKQYHTQMIDKAKLAVEVQAGEERAMKATTLVLSEADVERAQEILAEAHRKVRRLARSSSGSEVYQLNSQLFRLTNQKRKAAVADETASELESPAPVLE